MIVRYGWLAQILAAQYRVARAKPIVILLFLFLPWVTVFKDSRKVLSIIRELLQYILFY